MHYRAFKACVIVLSLLMLSGCGGAPQLPSTNGTPPLDINEIASSTNTLAEPIYLNNCGNSASAEQVSERSQTISIEGAAQIGVSVELAQASVAGKYTTSNTIKKSQTVTAAPGTNMEFVLLWTEKVNEGTVTVNGYSGQATYQVSVPISVELASAKSLGCSNDSASQTNDGNRPESPTQAIIPTATLPIVPTPTASGPTLTAGETWSQDGIEVFLDQIKINSDGISGYIVVDNQTGQNLMFAVDPSNISLTDNAGNKGRLYLRNCIFTVQQILETSCARQLLAGEKVSIDITFTGLNFGDTSIAYAVLAIKELSRAKNAKWQIVIPR